MLADVFILISLFQEKMMSCCFPPLTAPGLWRNALLARQACLRYTIAISARHAKIVGGILQFNNPLFE
jgi:hypothetical protein